MPLVRNPYEFASALYLDIETCPAQHPSIRDQIREALHPPAQMSKPETIAKWWENEAPAIVEKKWRQTSFDGAQGHVCVISAALNNAAPVSFCAGANWLESEASVLHWFFEHVHDVFERNNNRLPIVVGHWVRDFDLRFLYQRAVIHGVRWPAMLPTPGDHRIHERVYDTMYQWVGPRDRVTLDKLCRVMGIAGKGIELGGDDIDGSKVWDYVSAGRIDDVRIYCEGDVERVREVHQRMTFLT